MTSILTNSAAMAALQSLRASNSHVATLQNQTASGLRISEASHNAAYWSISVSMRSNVKAVEVVQDALGLAAALADVTYAALEETGEMLSEIRQRLLVARQDGIDLSVVQDELRQYALQAQEIAYGASFASQNWLVTDVEHIWEAELEDRSLHLLSSYSKSADGIRLGRIGVDLQVTSLFNAQGGGILEADPRSPHTIGGIRGTNWNTTAPSYTNSSSTNGSSAIIPIFFDGPFTLEDGEEIAFTLTVDADNPAHGLPGPLHPGVAHEISISRADIDAHFPGANGTVSTYQQMRTLLSAALSGTGAFVTFESAYPTGNVPDKLRLFSSGTSGRDGASVAITGLSAPGGTGGLQNSQAWGTRGHVLPLSLQPFKVYKDVEIDFSFRTNSDTPVGGRIDRELVDTLLGRDDGIVESAEDFAVIVEHIVGRPDLTIEVSGNHVVIRTQVETDRFAGPKSYVGFSGVTVNIEPIPQVALLDIDLSAQPHMLAHYEQAIDGMLERTIKAAAYVDALKMRIDIQSSFAQSLSDSLERGIGTLVDADMEKLAATLQAEQVRTQLALQSLSIANATPNGLMQLFGN
jgi:flagellin